jgi:hypothetical protein
LGTAVSQNSSGTDRAMPMFARLMTTIVQRTHTENPRFSARIDQPRFRRAICFPVVSQNVSSSGSQCSIHPLRTF